jgi:hypothetical protein
LANRLPRGFDQILVSLGSDACVEICVVTDLRHIIRQVRQFVQDDVRFKVTNGLDKCRPVEDITKNRLSTESPTNFVLLGERVMPRPIDRLEPTGESIAAQSLQMRQQEIFSSDFP